MNETGRNSYKKQVKNRLKNLFPGCMLFDLDPNVLQGVPDLLILYRNQWATLEVKIEKDAHHQPNQDYYVELMNGMSFSRFIFPEIEEEVFRLLYEHFNFC